MTVFCLSPFLSWSKFCVWNNGNRIILWTVKPDKAQLFGELSFPLWGICSLIHPSAKISEHFHHMLDPVLNAVECKDEWDINSAIRGRIQSLESGEYVGRQKKKVIIGMCDKCNDKKEKEMLWGTSENRGGHLSGWRLGSGEACRKTSKRRYLNWAWSNRQN